MHRCPSALPREPYMKGQESEHGRRPLAQPSPLHASAICALSTSSFIVLVPINVGHGVRPAAQRPSMKSRASTVSSGTTRHPPLRISQHQKPAATHDPAARRQLCPYDELSLISSGHLPPLKNKTLRPGAHSKRQSAIPLNNTSLKPVGPL